MSAAGETENELGRLLFIFIEFEQYQGYFYPLSKSVDHIAIPIDKISRCQRQTYVSFLPSAYTNFMG
jgi:hypothetical protein